MVGYCKDTLFCVYDHFLTWLYRVFHAMLLVYTFNIIMAAHVSYPLAAIECHYSGETSECSCLWKLSSLFYVWLLDGILKSLMLYLAPACWVPLYMRWPDASCWSPFKHVVCVFVMFYMASVDYLIERVLCFKLWVVSFWHFAWLSSCFLMELYKRKENSICFEWKCLLFILCLLYSVDMMLRIVQNLMESCVMDVCKNFMATLWLYMELRCIKCIILGFCSYVISKSPSQDANLRDYFEIEP